jgi:hypothetical protein
MGYVATVKRIICYARVNGVLLCDLWLDVITQSEWDGSDELWHEIKITLQGDHLSFLRDGKLIHELYDDALLNLPTTGRLMLETLCSYSRFDNVKVIGTGDTLNVPADYLTIQAAIDAAESGDTVLVAPGMYAENLDFLGKAITVKSSDGPEATVIDGGQNASVVTFVGGEGLDSVLDGFTLTNGRDLGIYPMFRGGGITCHDSSPFIRGNIIKNNQGEHHGGGIACIYCSPHITGNVIMHNTAGSGYNQNGGGIYIDGNHHGHPVIVNNVIAFNTSASYGGGIHCHVTSPTIVNNTIFGNAAVQGGGIGCLHSSPSITNTILWDNTDTSGWPEIWEGDQNPVVTFCDVKGGWPGTGNIDADPLFIDRTRADFHLRYLSPCRDSGDDEAATSEDMEGDLRSASDIGADEFATHLYCMGSTVPGSGIDLKIVGYPLNPITLFMSCGYFDPPMPTKYGDWYLETPCHAFVLETMPWSGFLSLHKRIPPDCPPDPIPLQALVRAELTNLCTIRVEEGSGPGTSVAYFYDSDQAGALDFKDYYDANGYDIELIAMDEIASHDLAAYDLLVAGQDTGNFFSWGNPDDVAAVIESKKPVIGIGRGGSCLFEEMNLTITWGGCAIAMYDTDRSVVVDETHAVFNTPYPIEIPPDKELPLYTTPPSEAMIFYYKGSPGPEILTDWFHDQGEYSLLTREGKYVLWGHNGAAPGNLNDDGKHLFLNVMHFLITLPES